MSEPNGQGTDSRSALGQLAEAAPDLEPAISNDPWFAPAPKPHGYQTLDADAMDAAGWPKADGNGHEPAARKADASLQTAAEPDVARRADEWFLRTGRAGLMPESMSEIWDDEDTHVFARPDTAGAPPWVGEQQDREVDEPPPWESEPWPGPGEERPARQPRSAGGQPRMLRMASDDTDNWQATAALVAGIVPLVVPGAVLGVLGLRRARSTGTGRFPSWIGIALSAIWAVVLIVVLASGSSGPGCSASSQAAVSGSMSAVLRDMTAGAPASTVKADLSQAMSQANAAAAAAQQVSVRGAYVTLTTALSRAIATVAVSRPATSSYAALISQLSADNAALTSACKG